MKATTTLVLASQNQVVVSRKICPIHTLSARSRMWIHTSKEAPGVSVTQGITWRVSSTDTAT